MLNRRATFWATILLIAALTLSACAPRAGQGAADADPGELVIDLPALVLDVGPDGSVAVGNVPFADLEALVGPILSDVSVPPIIVPLMIAGNIQHIQVSNTPDGLLLLVNGEDVPSISYDGDSLSTTADALSTFGVALPMMDQLLGLVNQIGIGVIARFPVLPGVEAIPLYIEGNGSAAMAEQKAQKAYLAAVGTPPRINLPIFYEADGSFSIGNMTDSEWGGLTGDALSILRLNPSQLALAAQYGISELGISTDIDGITIIINGNALPTLDWSDGKANHLLNLISQIGVLDMAMPGGGALMAMIHGFLPIIQTVEFDLTMHLPASSMASR